MLDSDIFVGVDEAGRGPLAGPVTAACVCFPADYVNPLITDSKKLTHRKREQLFGIITENALAYSVISVGAKRIDQINILQATKLAMRLAVERVEKTLIARGVKSEQIFVQIDGNQPIKISLRQESIVKGDQKVMVIGAASILAKVTRDRLMTVLAAKYPGYDLEVHKGYPTRSHLESIKKNGPSPIHRQSFRGVKQD